MIFIVELGVGGAGSENFLVVGVGIGVGLDNQLLIHALLPEVILCHKLRVAAQHNIGTTTSHVGGNGYSPQLTCLGNDLCFLLVVLGVQNVMGNAFLFQQLGEHLGLLNGDGAHQHRLTLFMTLLHLGNHCAELSCLGLVNHIRMVNTNHGLVSGNLDDVQIVDLNELVFLGQRGTGHTGEFVVKTEIVLEGNGGKGFGLVGNIHAFLCLDGLMQTLGVAAAIHQSSGEFIYDDDLTVLDHVVNIPAHDATGFERLIYMVGNGVVLGIGQVFNAKELLCLFDTGSGQGGSPVLLVDDIVAVQIVLGFLIVGVGKDHLLHPRHQTVCLGIELRGCLALAGDNQRGTGFINEDGVHLVHDAKGVTALHHLGFIGCHVVTEVVKAHFVVGAVGNVGSIGFLPLLVGEPVDNQTHGQTHVVEDLAHPLGVTLCQIVVDGDNVDAVSGESVEVSGENFHQRFTFTGFHLGDSTLMEDDAADELHPIGTHAQYPVCCLTNGSKGIGQNVVQGFTLLETTLEHVGLAFQLRLAHGMIGVAQRLNAVHNGSDGFDLPLGMGAEQLVHGVGK